MNRLSLLPVALALTASIACGSTSSSTSVGPTPTRCAVAVTSSPATFPPAGGSGNLVISAARECSWSASTQASWIALGQPAQGQGDGAVRYSVAPNPQGVPRSGMLTVGSQSAQVTQEPAPCQFELDRRSFDLGAAEQTATVEVRAPGGCSWTAASSVAWITIVEGAQGSGTAPVRFQVAANGGAATRAGSLQVAGLRVDVRQAAASGPQPPPLPPGDCSYELVPNSALAGPEQTDGSVVVQTDTGCSWSATSDASWLTIVAGASGSGAGQVTYRAAQNTSTSPRTGQITVQGALFTLEQGGAGSPPPPVCSYDINPTSDDVPADGGTGRVDVRTDPLCVWSASASASWIDITDGSSDIGDGRVDYTVEANTSTTPRTGTIQIANREFTINQEGAPEPPPQEPITLTGSVRNTEGSCPDKRFRVDGQDIRTTSATNYLNGDCGDIRNNASVRVTGIVSSNGVLTADEVEF